jgi:hypothetical protein
MKTHGGSEAILHLGTRCGWSASCPSCFTPEKEPLVHIGWEGGWTSDPVWTLCNTEKSLALAGNWTLAHSLSLYQLSHPKHLKYLVYASAEELLQCIRQLCIAGLKLVWQHRSNNLSIYCNPRDDFYLLSLECKTTFLINFALFL